MKSKPLPQNYTHAEAEKRWQQHWVKTKTYAWQNDQPRANTFVIDTPPPTVSGLLHMGHVFSYTQCDFVARYRRMKGMDVFYPMGFDDNGLPTERLVEKAKKIRATDMSREDFIAQCMSVSEEARAEFRDLFQSIALSVDWAQEYHTISESSRRISQSSFLDLFAKGEVERRLQPFFWDPVDQTAIAQAEIEDKELDSSWNDIWFGIEGSDEKILIGTTRPEMIPACVAIFYHPDDGRYTHLKGKHAITPLFGARVPILTDDTVDPEKGTGIMMCCTFGDEADIEKWKKHKLETKVILNKFGKMDLSALSSSPELATPTIGRSQEDSPIIAYGNSGNDVVEKLNGKKVSNRDPKHLGARETIIDLLRESGDLKESKPIRHAVKCAERSGAPLEILPTHQWFVKVCDKKDALKARARECDWKPDWMRLRIEQWIDGLNSDWCISRQRYFGVPFPIWYVWEKIGERTSHVTHRAGDGTIKGEQEVPVEDFKLVDMIIAGETDLPVNPISTPPSDIVDIISQEYPGCWRAKSKETGKDLRIVADFDVMDTWATSSISPQLSAGGINTNDDRFAKLFPADLRPQAHEIIRTWAFYTIVKAHLHSNTIPWHNLMISGWCLAEDKTKMSKSKGNVVTPVELIEEQGTDAVRYWAATSRLGADTAFSKDLLKIGKKLVNKLWNATKFAAIHLEKLDGEADATLITAPLDRWILTRLHRAVAKATEAFESYEYADALRATEDFFWNDFCDNYLELVKARVYDETGSNAAGQRSAVHAIYFCLQGILRLFAPFVPHITEELFSHIFADDYAKIGSLHARGMWPNAADYLVDAQAEVQGSAAVQILEVIRKAKSERGVSIKFPIEQVMLFASADAPAEAEMQPILEDVKAAGNVAELLWSAELPEAATYTDDSRFALSLRFAPQADVA